MDLISNTTGNWTIYRIVHGDSSTGNIIRIPKLGGFRSRDAYFRNYKTVKKTLDSLHLKQLNALTIMAMLQ